MPARYAYSFNVSQSLEFRVSERRNPSVHPTLPHNEFGSGGVRDGYHCYAEEFAALRSFRREGTEHVG